MTTRKKRQQQRMKAYGIVLRFHKCGRGIFVGDDMLFFPAQERPGMDPAPGKDPIIRCPQCHRELQEKDITEQKPSTPA